MDINESLTTLNLTTREAQIYTSLLELGQATPLQLANRTGLKRPTVYLDLESLRRKKLAGLTFKGKKSAYVPESPNKLAILVREQQRTLTEVLPLLRALENKAGTKPQFRMYDRAEEMQAVWLHETWQAPESRYISHVSAFAQSSPPSVFAEFTRRIRQQKITVQEIVTDDLADVQYAKSVRLKNHRARILPPNTRFDVDISLWEQHVSLYSIQHRYLTVISDPSIAQAFRTLFDLTWTASRDPKKLDEK